ncbi:hypothetical protein HDU87_003943 [Geranomyces variabilis]|uniref:Plasma membrane ATPase n=1 Tax=Geranomyces variabilis TaxID=109894 RepID=A0AAD5XUE3_9FUNG|nr:hypothetical protein HDU87_003943 [Geranomyces variabilis]
MAAPAKPSYEVHIPIDDEPAAVNPNTPRGNSGDDTTRRGNSGDDTTRRGNSGDNTTRDAKPARTSTGATDRKQSQGGEKKKYRGDEYQALLEFVHDEEEKEKHKDEDTEEVEDQEFTRLWYMPWKKIPVDSGKEKAVPPDWLDTDITKGLSDGDIESRRKDHGYNELTSPTENQFLKFVSYFRGSILYVMEIAVILSAGLQDWIDFGVIIAILLMNAAVGWYQEKSAGDIVAQLKAGIAMKATVVRNGTEQEIEARELVIGDVIVLKEGKTIPADAKIVADYKTKEAPKTSAQTPTKAAKTDDKRADAAVDSKVEPKKSGDKNEQEGSLDTVADHHHHADKDADDKGPSILSVDQSAITGESLAADKYAGEIAYYTCGVKRGEVYAVVCSSAKQSFVGKTAMLVMNSNEKGHFQIVLGEIGNALLVLVIFFIFAVWVDGFFRGTGIATPKENSLLVYALVFFIIGVPVGLPCVTTTTMAVGAAYLARRKCIVQKLTAIESLAGVDMLCTDKTGTLTANKLSLNEPFLMKNVDPDWFMTVAVLASSHNIEALDPIDKVTILALKNYPKAQENLKSGWKTIKFTPFDPTSKRITSEVSKDGKKFVCAKGAPKALLKLKEFAPNVVVDYNQKTQEFARKGFRSLGVAVKEDGKDWELLGIMAMSDPPRGDTAATIAEAQTLGIRIKMLTGDAVAIGKELARQLHLGTNIFDSEKLLGGTEKGSEIMDFIEAADGFAEVKPEDKHTVVSVLQQRGHLVAMTGDGVNDAPSLKKADCGIAVEGASDAARSAAAVVFLDEGLKSIITSIKVARQIFHRMKSYILYRIALCIHLEIYLLLSILILNETIRVDLIVFLAIFADVATIAIAYDRAPFAQAPVEWQLPKVWVISTVIGLLLAAGTWIVRGTLLLNDNTGIIANHGSVQEILFLEVALTESWVIFITRLNQGKGEVFVWPSWQLVGAVLGVDILATLFCAFGWISGSGYPEDDSFSGRTDIVTIVRVWLFSFGVTVVIAFFSYLLNKWSWLDRLGAKTRSKKNRKMEDFLHSLSQLTIIHEQADGRESFKFAPAEGSKDTRSADRSTKKDDDKDSGSEDDESDKSDDASEKESSVRRRRRPTEGNERKSLRAADKLTNASNNVSTA